MIERLKQRIHNWLWADQTCDSYPHCATCICNEQDDEDEEAYE
jgi:hypothetical protein